MKDPKSGYWQERGQEFRSIGARWRRLSRVALVFAAISALTVVVLDAVVGGGLGSGFSSLAREAVYVLVGIVLSTLLLPEIREDLWHTGPDELAETVPPRQLRAAIESATEAVAGRDVGPVAWRHAIKPLLDAYEGGEVRADFQYTIRLTDGGDRVLADTVDRCRRVVPVSSASTIWVSLCRTEQALDREFAASGDGCINRELAVGPDPMQWEADAERFFRTQVSLDGRPCKPLAKGARAFASGADGIDVVRLLFEVPDGVPVRRFGHERAESVDVALETSFWLPPGDTRFPVIFGSYFCVGQTEVDFSINVAGVSDLTIDHRLTLGSHGEPQHFPEKVGSTRWRRAFPDQLLWKGSAISISWDGVSSHEPA